MAALFAKKNPQAPVMQEPVHNTEPQAEKAEQAPAVPTPEPAKKAPPMRKRPFDHHVWFSGEEERRLQIRADEAGLSAGVFIRKAALENPIMVNPKEKELETSIQQFTAELKFIHSELGKHGGMLKMAIKPNEGQKEASPEEWKLLVEANHNAVATQKQVFKTMEAINGYFKTHQF